MTASDVLRHIVQRLEPFHPRQIILFGSQARGTADERSDFDLLIVGEAGQSRRQRVLDMDRALRGLGIARDIVLLTPQEYERDRQIPGTVAWPAWLEGKVLYDSAS